ncbi:hypothetical protein IV203_017837 [Nitzschia inconspicua]|uniref:Uncharacterized protein n=1 Tax=Nitzschia inconspicua TaxID=303405 RepID=A0A9K3PD72_9STRA|nr:hypothetical protein IV203_020538 [Nitzschia inconspicua]KAG7371696.1 hypothetical protein IV203_017837 [Nitzschia inconspicua]
MGGKNKPKGGTGGNHNSSDGGKVFLLDIRNDSQPQPKYHHHHNNNSNSNNSNNNFDNSFHSKLQILSETAVHRKIIDLFKSRDDFQQVDLNIRTSRSLSSTTRIDLSNALMHMRSKGKHLRRLSADIDYMDPSVHEFVLLNCLWFDEVRITSNPEEQTYLSSGLAMSLRHALTMNVKCTRVLDLTCGLSDEISELLGEAMIGAHQLEVLKVHLLAGNPHIVATMLEGLRGKPKLKELHLTDVTATISESLASLLRDSNCRLQELDLSHSWDAAQPFHTAVLCEALADVQNKSVTKLILDGIDFYHSDSSTTTTTTTKVLPLAFPNMETLSIASSQMPNLDFLELPIHQLPHKLKSCYFPCTNLDLEQGRNLVERLPSVTDIPDFASDVIVQHLLDWRKVLGRQQAPKAAAVWPFILERTNIKLHDHPHRRANMLYTLLQDFYGLRKNGQLIFPGDDKQCNHRDEAAAAAPVVVATKTKRTQISGSSSSSNNSNNNQSNKEKVKVVAEEAVAETADFSMFDTFDSTTTTTSGDY